ncbi:hypothetical protein AAVH_12806 [Aphelenchoides avenae]|nr:hypothetical protein AAVH_12806 [Aphelenchus avenae]
MEWDERSGDPSRAPKRLSKPTKIDKPMPDVEMLCSSMPSRQQCEMHSFVNATQWKCMEVFKWSAKSDRGSDRHTTHFLQ